MHGVKNSGNDADSKHHSRSQLAGFAFYTMCLATLMLGLQYASVESIPAQLAAIIGMLGVWRYSWGLVHFFRSLIYRKIVFPQLREHAEQGATH